MSDKATKDQGQRTAEAEVEHFHENLGPFVIAADTTRMPMVFTDATAGNPIIYANAAFVKLSGYEHDELLGRNFDFLLARQGNSGDLDRIAKAFRDEEDNAEISYRKKDGSRFCATIFVNPVADEDGKIVQHFVSLVDTTRHERAREHAAMLIDELNHRVKNTLATVQSIVAQALRNSADPQVVREAIESRIAALSRLHDLLGREKWDGAGMRDMLSVALAPFNEATGDAERFTVAGDNIRLSPKSALALGIAFNELATNAVNHGALSNASGTIAISWTISGHSDERRLQLCWREQGGPPVSRPARKGFGSRVIEQGLAHELDGEIDLAFRPEGIDCLMDFPVPVSVFNG